ncbi:hypothetical protein FRC20_005031 [Serendipita sp. 405]|nr:hypothetical protein FRC15_006536 [Serendipita sp. 397]KAG8775479.1 hypothetical protein FRC16_004810 [Serendipita sp. 398]KAG8841456.1 hypothetical protein FRC20_005031 [Serendipita sp. 405]
MSNHPKGNVFPPLVFVFIPLVAIGTLAVWTIVSNRRATYIPTLDAPWGEGKEKHPTPPAFHEVWVTDERGPQHHTEHGNGNLEDGIPLSLQCHFPHEDKGNQPTDTMDDPALVLSAIIAMPSEKVSRDNWRMSSSSMHKSCISDREWAFGTARMQHTRGNIEWKTEGD